MQERVLFSDCNGSVETCENKFILDKTMYDHYPDSVIFSRDGIITYINEAGLKLVRLEDKQQVIGKELAIFIHPSQRSEIVNRIQNIRFGNEPLFISDLILVRGDQTQILSESISLTLYDLFGNRFVISIVRDITERKRSEEMLAQSEKLSVMGQLAAGVAHEIRNPLAALKGFTQLLRSKIPGYTEYFNIMISEIDRINLIVNEFMTLAKPHFAELVEGRLEPIIRSVISILETQSILYNVEIRLELDSPLPVVLCNENQLKQVFLNVIKNGIEAMPDGGELRINCFTIGNKVKIIITDEGGGIPPELLPKLGEPFVTTKEKGTGLGLMISSRIIEEHNGKLDIVSQVDLGTRVTITLPAYT